MRFTLACPKAYAFGDDVAEEFAGVWGDQIRQSHDPQAAVADADVLYSDVFTSMGQEDEAVERRAAFAAYQINAELLDAAPGTAKIMHCLPAHRARRLLLMPSKGRKKRLSLIRPKTVCAQKAILRLLWPMIGRRCWRRTGR